MAKRFQHQLAHLLMARPQLNRQVSQRYESGVSQRLWDLLQLTIDPLTRRHDEVTTEDPSIVCSTHKKDDTLSIHNPEPVDYMFIKEDVALPIESFVESSGSNPSPGDVLIQNDKSPNKFRDERVQEPWRSHDASLSGHAFPDFQLCSQPETPKHSASKYETSDPYLPSMQNCEMILETSSSSLFKSYMRNPCFFPHNELVNLQIYQLFSNLPKKFSPSNMNSEWNLCENESGIDFALTSSSRIKNYKFHPMNIRCYKKSTRHGKIVRSKRVKNKKKRKCRKSSSNKTRRKSIHTESSIKYSKPDDNKKSTKYPTPTIDCDNKDPKRSYSTAVIFHTNIPKQSQSIEYCTPKPPDGECTKRPNDGESDNEDTDTRRKKELEQIEKCKSNIKGNTKKDTTEKKT